MSRAAGAAAPLDGPDDRPVRPRAGAGPAGGASRITADALVMATGRGAAPDAADNRVLAAAVEPLTVAELAARLGTDTARTRAAVAELWATGHLAVTTSPDAAREVDLLRRVLVGLRAYS